MSTEPEGMDEDTAQAALQYAEELKEEQSNATEDH